MSSAAPQSRPLDERLDGLERELVQLKSRIGSALWLSRFLAALLLMSVAGILFLLLFPEWNPTRPVTRSNSPETSPWGLTQEVKEEIYQANQELTKNMLDMKKELKEDIADARRQARADSTGIRKQLLELTQDVKKDALALKKEVLEIRTSLAPRK